MANRLRNLKLERIDLVDAPANPGARVVLVKRDDLEKRIRHRNGKYEVTTEDGSKVLGTHDSRESAQRQLAAIEANKDAPGVGAVHVNSPDLRSRSRRTKRIRSTMPKNALARVLSGFRRVLKDAEAEGRQSFVPKEGEAEGAPPPGSDEHESEEMRHLHELEDLHKKMAEAMTGAQYPDDHPMKKLHGELAMKIAEARKLAEGEQKEGEASAEADAGADGDEDMGRVHKSVAAINKKLEEVTKALEASNKRATDAEAIAKAERDTRELGDVKVELRKFAHLKIDVDKEAPIYKSLRDSNKAAYDAMIASFTAANETARASDLLTKALGSGVPGTTEGSAWAEICAEADKIVAKGEGKITKEKARNMIMDTRLDLTKRYYAEQGKNDPVAGVQ